MLTYYSQDKGSTGSPGQVSFVAITLCELPVLVPLARGPFYTTPTHKAMKAAPSAADLSP
jgi:hypothetical protein